MQKCVEADRLLHGDVCVVVPPSVSTEHAGRGEAAAGRNDESTVIPRPTKIIR